MPRLCTLDYWAQQNSKLQKTRAHAKCLSSVPWSNAPTYPSHMFCLCTIAKLRGHDHRRQRGQHLDGMYPHQHWTCFPEATSNPLHFITHLPLWKKKGGRWAKKKGKKPANCPRVKCLQLSHSLHIPPCSWFSPWQEDLCTLQSGNMMLLYFHLFPLITPMVEASRKVWFLHSDLPRYSPTMAAAQATLNTPPALTL